MEGRAREGEVRMGREARQRPPHGEAREDHRALVADDLRGLPGPGQISHTPRSAA